MREENQHPLLSIITVNYNQIGYTAEMLRSLERQSFTDYEVILVDNASTDDPRPFIETHFPWVHLIVSPENLGFAGGNNLGVQQARGQYFFFVNNDTELTEGLIEQLLALFQKVPKLGCVSPMICYFPEENKTAVADLIQYAGTTPVNPYTARNRTLGEKSLDEGQFPSPYPTPYAHGAAMLLPREVLEKVGLMSEDFFLYYEELDWCEQIRRAGYEVYVEPRAKIYHKESVSVGPMSPLKTYYLTRNRILFMRRNRSASEVFIFALFLLGFTAPKWTLLYALRGQWDLLRAFWKAIIWHVFNSAEVKPNPMTQVDRLRPTKLKKPV